ncbi:hypothetical protein, partial [Archangium sp.]|uniref:roadblock/LC7 domain-containing protein n=1 Tax=Archangium sp. TaxID=1872627 RepID=UPI002ED99E68
HPSYKPAAMSFRTHLESVVNQVDGALACSVMGFDGISVETLQKEEAADLELNGTWVEYANLLGQLRQAAEALKTGEVQEVSVNSERVMTLMRLVSPEYFLILALRTDGNYGKGRYVLRVIAPKIRAEL